MATAVIKILLKRVQKLVDGGDYRSLSQGQGQGLEQRCYRNYDDDCLLLLLLTYFIIGGGKEKKINFCGFIFILFLFFLLFFLLFCFS